MIKRILGFDVSSTCIGYCLLEWDDVTNSIKFVDMNNHKPIKKGNMVERLYHTRGVIQKIIANYNPDYIGIEDIIQFMKNKSRAITVITLAVFNRMVGLAAHDHLGHSPEFFNVMQIRHGLKIDKELPKKEDMPELVAKHLGITFPYVYKKSGALAEESGDMADGVAVALYYAFVLTGKVTLKVKKPKKRKKK
jgi:Holliday junction resolvasome RuvABC endonuclease subunit